MHDQAGDGGVPGPVILAVLSADPRGGAVGAAEDDRAAHLAARHVIGLRRRIDDVIDRLHREVEGHELDDRLQAAHRRAGADAGKAIFGDRRVDHALGAELVEQALGDLVGALIFGDLLAHHEDPVVGAHLLGHRVAQRLADGGLDHLGAFGHVGIGDIGAGGRGGELARCRSPPSPAAVGFRLRRGRCFSLRRGLRPGRRAGGRRDVLALGRHQRDHRADLHLVRAFGNEDLRDRPFVDRLELHRRLVGLDLGEDVARRRPCRLP